MQPYNIINKLLRALELKHQYIYCINRNQFYSPKNKRRCTKIVLHRRYEDKLKKIVNEKEEFWNPIDCIKFLADKLKELNEYGQEERNQK